MQIVEETICMKCQSLFFWEKSEKYLKMLSVEILIHHTKRKL